ncbi:beta-glucosidase, partial [Pseudovirgaria hyperparasitica]
MNRVVQEPSARNVPMASSVTSSLLSIWLQQRTMTTSKLPQDFVWGFATAAYQIEGAPHTDGRLDSIWDTFSHTPGKTAGGDTGDVACDSYHRAADDIRLLRELGAKVYRFSISWPRVIPLGGRDDPVNAAGLAYYKTLVVDLIAAGIAPWITLYHWDLPEALEARYGGMRNGAEFIADYTRFARVMFEALPECKFWVTFNEPWCSSVLGYSTGLFAPGRTSDRTVSEEGDSSTEPWIVGHHMLLAHASAVKVYREEFKARDGGQIGITLNGDWAEPWDAADPLDVEACERKMEFATAWFGDPIYFGTYPASMRAQLGVRLPKFTDAEAALVRGSNDFYGMNHYCAHYIRHRDEPATADDYAGNVDILPTNKAGDEIGPATQSVWLRPHAPGFRKLLCWLSARYGRPVMYVTENGTSVAGENGLAVEDLLQDEFRCRYFEEYITAMADARAIDGVDVRGYTAWSLLDNFEWAEGYETRFGVTYVDYAGGQKRYPKKSARVIGQVFDRLIEKA